MRFERALVLLFIMASVLGFSACNRSRRAVEASNDDTAAAQAFTEEAQEAHLSEIRMARQALEHSQNHDVKNYAGMIIDDHTAALEKLAQVMEDNSIPQRGLVPDMQKDIDRMGLLSGVEFDREFINMMVADHTKALDLYRQTAAGLPGGDVGEYAAGMVYVLEKHLKKAQEIQSRLFHGEKP